jgi:hypothetical protein
MSGPARNGPPFVDEHSTLVAAPVAAVWRALRAQLPRFAGNEAFARVLGAEPRRISGPSLEAGSTLAGFAVARAVPERHVRLVGRHRYSRYALVLDLDERSAETVLVARTYAAFPGLVGGLYRGLVIGSGAHRLLVRRLLRDVRRRAERDGPTV